MAKIVLSMSGEGRGHASRAEAVAEALQDRHELLLLAPGDAWDLLEPVFRKSRVRVKKIPAPRFGYDGGGSLSYGRTALQGLSYARRFPGLIRDLSSVLRREHADLVISDFEPALPRAARRVGVPILSLSHQHVLAVADFQGLDAQLQRRVRWMGSFVQAYAGPADRRLVSSFYEPPLQAADPMVKQIGVLLRDPVRRARPTEGEHLVAYLRRSVPETVLRVLERCGRPVCIFGLGERAKRGNLSFRGLSNLDFVRELASCHALVCTAGNQLVGEAIHLNKPVLALPELGNWEQRLNAHFVTQDGVGLVVAPDELSDGHLEEFLARREVYRSRLPYLRRDGLEDVLLAIENQLESVPVPADPVVLPA